jgi:mannose-1-phosphate guanylyltransferase
MASSRYVVIMAGGIGSRFWPVSRTDYPKQFLDILRTGQTLIQQTFKRFEKIVPKENIYVVTADAYIDIVHEQLPLLPVENILGEPMRKNTAPCIAYICFKLLQKDPDASLVVAPSDHLILDEAGFAGVCENGLHFIESHPALLTLGIKPTYAATGYGYIQKAQEEFAASIYPVKRFIEKPYLELAKSFIKSDDFLWNAGIFIWKVKDVLEAYKKYLPDMFHLFDDSKQLLNGPGEEMLIQHIYPLCQDISIDFGIMEKSDNVYIIPSSFSWSDLGSWNSAWENMEKDDAGNAVAGKNVMVIDAIKCMVHASPEKMIVIQGLDEYIVADTKDALLICQKEKEQEIKSYLAEIKKSSGDQFLYNDKNNLANIHSTPV